MEYKNASYEIQNVKHKYTNTKNENQWYQILKIHQTAGEEPAWPMFSANSQTLTLTRKNVIEQSYLQSAQAFRGSHRDRERVPKLYREREKRVTIVYCTEVRNETDARMGEGERKAYKDSPAHHHVLSCHDTEEILSPGFNS